MGFGVEVTLMKGGFGGGGGDDDVEVDGNVDEE